MKQRWTTKSFAGWRSSSVERCKTHQRELRDPTLASLTQRRLSSNLRHVGGGGFHLRARSVDTRDAADTGVVSRSAGDPDAAASRRASAPRSRRVRPRPRWIPSSLVADRSLLPARARPRRRADPGEASTSASASRASPTMRANASASRRASCTRPSRRRARSMRCRHLRAPSPAASCRGRRYASSPRSPTPRATRDGSRSPAAEPFGTLDAPMHPFVARRPGCRADRRLTAQPSEAPSALAEDCRLDGTLDGESAACFRLLCPRAPARALAGRRRARAEDGGRAAQLVAGGGSDRGRGALRGAALGTRRAERCVRAAAVRALRGPRSVGRACETGGDARRARSLGAGRPLRMPSRPLPASTSSIGLRSRR